jgi:hypothetical protein
MAKAKHRAPSVLGTYRIGIHFGMVLATVLMLGGATLILIGLTGSIDLMVEAGGLRSRLVNASPSALFVLLGFLLAWKSKPAVSHQEEREAEPSGHSRQHGASGVSYSGAVIHEQGEIWNAQPCGCTGRLASPVSLRSVGRQEARGTAGSPLEGSRHE